MKATLPDPLEAYFGAVNRGDVDAMLAPFAADATVRDEGKVRRGQAAVREWILETTEKYHPAFEVVDVAEEGVGTTVVTGLVSGTFPGSPVRLRYSFTLAAGKIARLEIT
jgi:ketosteroid isomerase-like protein